jgi:rfaE bifunctional protein nucleotidyltransferase chain/domain
MITPVFTSKILDPVALKTKLNSNNSSGVTVFTNGVFDVLHRGHVSYLDIASQLGQRLVVALNTDRSAKMLGKGEERPLNTLIDRMNVIAALESVAYVTWFDEDTPLEIIKLLRPNVIVKGGDYDMSKLPETQFVQSYGGQAKTINFFDGYSTTALVKKIQSSKP